MRFFKKKVLFPLIGCAFVFVLLLHAFLFSTTKAVSSDGVDATIPVPIIMYHSILKNPAMHGDYVISPEVLEENLQYIKEKGYTAVFISDLVDYVYAGKSLPEKPIVITFDDGFYNNLTYALPLLEKYDMKAVISVVGEYIDKSTNEGEQNPNYSYLSWDVIKETTATGRIEFGNHSYYLHGTSPRKGAGIMRGQPPQRRRDHAGGGPCRLPEAA